MSFRGAQQEYFVTIYMQRCSNSSLLPSATLLYNPCNDACHVSQGLPCARKGHAATWTWTGIIRPSILFVSAYLTLDGMAVLMEGYISMRIKADLMYLEARERDSSPREVNDCREGTTDRVQAWSIICTSHWRRCPTLRRYSAESTTDYLNTKLHDCLCREHDNVTRLPGARVLECLSCRACFPLKN